MHATAFLKAPQTSPTGAIVVLSGDERSLKLDSLAALDVGDSRNVTLHFFGGLGDGLASMPEWCELTVTVGNVLEATDTIETLCYRPQQSLESGTCK